MATAEKTLPATTSQPNNLPAISAPRLPYHPAIKERFGIEKAEWKALVEAIFPTAVSIDSVILALSYCKARNLDPFKRNIHIVPIYNSQLRCMVDTVWPGIGELRTTAFRTGYYAGRGETKFGPDLTQKVGQVELTFPEWAQVTVFRMVGQNRVEFCGPRVYWLETYAVKSRNDDSPNTMWADRPRGQIDKCAEAAALRSAFPEEIGDYIPEEVQHASVIDSTATASAPAKPTLDTLTDKFTESNYKPPVSDEQEPEGVNGTDATHQGEAADDADQRPDEERKESLRLTAEHPLYELQQMLDVANSVGDITKAENSYLGPDSDQQFHGLVRKMAEARRDEVRSNRGQRSNK